jgi:segregation and condensation protein A
MEKQGSVFLEEIIEKDDASWQYIIYDLVKSGQIDPWDIDIIELTNKFLAKLEEMDRKKLHISSKVLLAAAILVKMKAELLYKSLTSKEKEREEAKEEYVTEAIDIALIPKIPLERERKITLEELMAALKSALKTEERRIRKRLQFRKLIDFSIVVPKPIDWLKKMNEVYEAVLQKLRQLNKEKIYFSDLLGKSTREEKAIFFISLIHLDFQKKLCLQQESFLSDIEISLYAGVPEPGQTGRT